MNAEYDGPECDYPLDDESMAFIMSEAGWVLIAPSDGFVLLDSNTGKALRVPAEETKSRVRTAFEMFMWLSYRQRPE